MSINIIVSRVSSPFLSIGPALFFLGLLSACVSPSKPPEPVVQPQSQSLPVAETNPFGPVVGEDGRCKGAPSIDLMALKSRNNDAGLVGVSECELVALKGEPLSVQSGSSPSAKRETTMLYMEATGKAVYLFANNQLVRVVRGNAP